MADAGSSVFGAVNASLRFLLELAALVALGYWGYSVGGTQLVKIGLGLGVPVTVAVVWGLLGSPAAPYRLDQPWRLFLEILILGGAAVALYLLDRPLLAVGFALVATVNTVLLYVLGQS